MVDKGVASRLQKSIIIYSAVCLFLVSVIIACASIVPFYFQLKGGVEKELLSALSSRGVAVEEYRLRVKDIALQITSRTRIRETLEAYNRGEVSLDELVNFTDSKLLDAMALSTEAAGVSRFDQQGKLVVQVGVPIAEGYLAGSDRTSIGVNIRGLVRQGGKPYVAVITPILNRRSVQVGTDIVLFRASNLRRIVKNYVALGETGETVLGTRRNGQLQSLFSLRGNKSGSSESIPKDSPLELALKRAFEREEGLLQPDEAASNSAVIAYGPIRNSDWVMAVKMDKAELYAPVTRQIALISGLIVGLILLGTFGMVLLVRPLSGKLIIHTDELEEEIEKKTVALQSLLDEHKRAEEELQARYLEIQSLHEISQSILSLPDLKSTLEMILDKALSVVRFDMGNVRLLDPDRQMLDLYVSKGYRDPQNAQRHLR
ncbi:MAG: cache domain-containing protein, partial [Candidatus Binatia bacterium]